MTGSSAAIFPHDSGHRHSPANFMEAMIENLVYLRIATTSVKGDASNVEVLIGLAAWNKPGDTTFYATGCAKTQDRRQSEVDHWAIHPDERDSGQEDHGSPVNKTPLQT